MVTLGEGKKTFIYVGTHHAMEWITSVLLLRFINEYAEAFREGRRIYNVHLPYLFKERRIVIIPMLNPDGVSYVLEGISTNNPLLSRLERMNPAHPDYSHWQANARGVDLNHNYDAGFVEYKALEKEAGIVGGGPTRYSGECPESEPEVGYLCNYLRFHRDNIHAVLTLHTQGEEIYYTSGSEVTPRSAAMAKALSRLCGYRLSVPDGMAAYGGLTDWCIRSLGLPSFTIECGKGENPLPAEQYFCIYASLRQMFFEAPLLL
jgi:g-D-glutamyl-meso-diaminopimelate peptidase